MKFLKEVDLCDAFLETVPKGWTPYPETAGWDILLVHESGAQVGVQAKLALNPKVVAQASQCAYDARTGRAGPDFRAVLVPVANNDLVGICGRLGITILTVDRASRGTIYGNANHGKRWVSKPALPKASGLDFKRAHWWDSENWYDQAPIQRETLPEYVPDVVAGDSAPVILSSWKIQAIKVCITVERRRFVGRPEFAALKISPTRWMDGHWLVKAETRGLWRAGPSFPADFYRKQHPSIFAKIEADWPEWSKVLPPVSPTQGALL